MPYLYNNEKIPYGDFKKILLTAKEYDVLVEKLPASYEKRINDLSHYIQIKVNKYFSRYSIIPNEQSKGTNELSTFETDIFFDRAIKRSQKSKGYTNR